MIKSDTAIRIMLFLLGVIIVFHFLILLKIIPYDITWGGRLTNDQEMYVFEGVSIVLNSILIIAILIKGDLINKVIPLKIANGILWFFFVVFVFNTIGNLLAKTTFEKFFSILTLLSAFLLWIILRSGKK